jgi:hypothetical protein
MAYLKAVIGAVLAALVLGTATGAVVLLKSGVAFISPADKATIYAASISEAVNCAAFFIVVLVPISVLLLFIVRRWRRPAAGREG